MLPLIPSTDSAPDRQEVSISDRPSLDESELARLNRIKDHFIAMLAHELRNPLAPILNAVEMLRSSDPADAVDVIERQVKHMARLLDDLLDLSRVTMGKITLQKTVIDLAETARAAARTVRPIFVQNRLVLSMTLPADPVWVEADPVRIEQIVGNLLNNAIKSTSPTARPIDVWLELERTEGEAVLRVRDRGIGIPGGMLARIFEPYVQLEGGAHHPQGGLGLGLSLVKQLVEMHGGKALATSEGLGRGAEFCVRLPVVPRPGKAEAAAGIAPPGLSATLQGTPSRIRRRVLVVEDNIDIANTVARLLTVWGHAAKTVNEGAGAIAAALAHQPQVVILDLGLPDMDGCLVARQLLALPKLHGLHIIAMTGYGQEADRLRAASAGCRDYLLKPVDPALLRRLVENL